MSLFQPKIPWYDWRTYRTMFRSRGAWWPSMGVLACLCLLFLSFVLGDPLAKVVTTVWLGTLLLVCVLFGVALVGASAHAVQTVYRLGPRGWCRPRWWFTWANLAWSLVVLVILIVGPSCALAPKVGLVVWGDAIWRFGRLMVIVLFWMFMAAAAAGYVVSTIAGRPKRGNAYACVQFAFPLVGGMILVAIAALNWPAGGCPGWPVMVLGAFGGATMILGVYDLVRTHGRECTARHPADLV